MYSKKLWKLEILNLLMSRSRSSSMKEEGCGLEMSTPIWLCNEYVCEETNIWIKIVII